MADATLETLMARYCDGDAAAFRELYRAVAPRIQAFLVRLSGDRATAEDVLQLTFLKVHNAREAYVRGADPIPWLYAIAHRTYLDEARRRQRARVQLARSDDPLPEVPATLTGEPEEHSPGEGRDPELTRAALDALSQLPDNQRVALVLTKLEGRSVAEAAQITGSTRGAIKLRAHRAYVTLRKLLGGRGEDTRASPSAQTAAGGDE